jgi:PAS domain S-box-containing protein
MLQSRLFLKVLSAMIAVLSALAAAIYFVAVPLVERNAYQVEVDASRTILDNVFELTSRLSGNLEERREVTVGSFKSQMKSIVDLAGGYVEYVFERRDKGDISDQEARQLVFEGLRAFKYGDDGYIWVTGYDARIMSHPDAAYHGRDASNIIDSDGSSILPTIVAIARRQGEGFHTYPWTKLGSTKPSQKLSYFKDLPRYGLVVGSGAYLDEIDREVDRRKVEAIEGLRAALRGIRIARSGYAYIFDANANMIIHPNPNIEGAEFSARPNPASGMPIAEELKSVADSGKPLSYLWDKPSDPGNYSYEKLSWVRHFKQFDWYIASSVYVEELKASSRLLGDRILGIAAGIIGLTGLALFIAARRFVEPLQQLALTAIRVRSGDLEAQSGVVRRDEIGVLAAAFDGMIARLRENVTMLGNRVSERTRELEEANRRLQHAADLQQRSQAELAEAEARQRLILDAIPASIAYLDADERVKFANRGWREMIGRSVEEVAGARLADVVGARAYGVLTPHLQRTRNGDTVRFEYAFRDRRGKAIIANNVLIPHMDGQGRPVGLFVLSRDVTDEKEAGRRLMEAQRLNAVGQLAGGLAHDFNNLLSIIIGNMAAARDKYADVEGLASYLEPAQRAGRRGADITSRLLSFARQHPLRSEPIDVGDLVREVVVLLQRTLPSRIRIQWQTDAKAVWALTDQSQLEHALINMALNARDAMPDGGCLSFAAAQRTVGDGMTFDEAVKPGTYVEITVSDTGMGFTPESLARAFEPFFTTKSLGSGLGLSMVYGFVKQSKGYIRIDSRAEGTAITILLPEASTSGEAIDAAAAAPATADGAWRGVLAVVAEDDEDVRRVIREQLNGLGLSVLEAATGEEALRLAEQVDNVRLLVSDIVMPGMSGIELMRRVRALKPEIAVVLMTGFSVSELPEDLAGVPLLMKPWRQQDLRQAIGRQLAGETGNARADA